MEKENNLIESAIDAGKNTVTKSQIDSIGELFNEININHPDVEKENNEQSI